MMILSVMLQLGPVVVLFAPSIQFLMSMFELAMDSTGFGSSSRIFHTHWGPGGELGYLGLAVPPSVD